MRVSTYDVHDFVGRGGESCPQREIAISNEFLSFQEAVIGIRFTTRKDQMPIRETYSDSRPNIVLEGSAKGNVRAVRVPPSAFITGLRAAIFLRDPLLAIKECQPVDVTLHAGRSAYLSTPFPTDFMRRRRLGY
jgi:hypothetical protein